MDRMGHQLDFGHTTPVGKGTPRERGANFRFRTCGYYRGTTFDTTTDVAERKICGGLTTVTKGVPTFTSDY